MSSLCVIVVREFLYFFGNWDDLTDKTRLLSIKAHVVSPSESVDFSYFKLVKVFPISLDRHPYHFTTDHAGQHRGEDLHARPCA